MDEAEQDQYEARLKELFDSFDSTGTGSLGQEELTDLCHVLHLEEVAPALQQTLLQDNLLGRVRPGWAPFFSAWLFAPIPEISRAARPPQAPATWMLLSAFVAHAHTIPATSSTPSSCPGGCAGDPKEDFFPSLCLQGRLALTTLP